MVKSKRNVIEIMVNIINEIIRKSKNVKDVIKHLKYVNCILYICNK